MTEHDERRDETDDRTREREGLEFGRRAAMKGGAAGLAAIGLGTLASQPVAGHLPADKVGAAGKTKEIMEVSKNSNQNHSKLHTLLGPIEAKFSQGEDVLMHTALETALLTKVKTTGNDKSSTAEAGVLGWVEIDGRMVTVDGGRKTAPGTAGDLFDSSGNVKSKYADGVVTFDNRAFHLETHFSEFDDDEFIEAFIKTRSTHGFNWIAVDAGGKHTDPGLSVEGVLTVFVDDKNAEASAAVRNRTFISEPTKLPHGVNGH